jgi:hypothetical protein
MTPSTRDNLAAFDHLNINTNGVPRAAAICPGPVSSTGSKEKRIFVVYEIISIQKTFRGRLIWGLLFMLDFLTDILYNASWKEKGNICIIDA